MVAVRSRPPPAFRGAADRADSRWVSQVLRHLGGVRWVTRAASWAEQAGAEAKKLGLSGGGGNSWWGEGAISHPDQAGAWNTAEIRSVERDPKPVASPTRPLSPGLPGRLILAYLTRFASSWFAVSLLDSC